MPRRRQLARQNRHRREPLAGAVPQSNAGFVGRFRPRAVRPSASRLELEITECVLLQADRNVLDALHQFRDLGVRICMDDFGTGYSSLSYLRSFPFDKIKIDRSFIRELGKDNDCMAIIRAVTAEGVETEEQLEILRAEGCMQVQGFLFSKAVRALEIPLLLQCLQPQIRAAQPLRRA